MKPFFFILVFFLGWLLPATAQTDTVAVTPHIHGLGIAAGGTTGYGLSYRYVPKKFGVQVTFAPYKDDERSHYSLGFTFLYTLVSTEKTNLFLYQGNHYLYWKEDFIDYIGGNEKITKYFHHGVGFGIEFIILKRVSFNLMAGYAAFENFDRLGFTGETGLYFKF